MSAASSRPRALSPGFQSRGSGRGRRGCAGVLAKGRRLNRTPCSCNPRRRWPLGPERLSLKAKRLHTAWSSSPPWARSRPPFVGARDRLLEDVSDGSRPRRAWRSAATSGRSARRGRRSPRPASARPGRPPPAGEQPVEGVLLDRERPSPCWWSPSPSRASADTFGFSAPGRPGVSDGPPGGSLLDSTKKQKMKTFF